MGVLNVTPDSFSDGGLYFDHDRALTAALAMIDDGADIVDVGGESTRPGARDVDEAEERRRVVPLVAKLAPHASVPISVDTTKAGVARAALDAGATIVNDISGLRQDAALGDVAARAGAALILMHMRGTPHDMYARAVYRSVPEEVAAELRWSLAAAVARGVSREAVILDPGIGFAKRAEHSWQILSHLDHPALLTLDRPWLVGPSRKSFLEQATGECPSATREWATAAAVTTAVLLGAHIVRVHSVREMTAVVRAADLVRRCREQAKQV
ncbi:MAG: dihydropteroate synthase [Luteitalea sp.]|nr:dihydropteroate synthase [Luteitalea sp.]